MYNEDIINRVEITGRIVGNTERPDGSRYITLYSTSGKKETYPSFVCPREKYKEIKMHTRVLVIGHVVSYIQKKDNKNIRVQRIIADSICPDKTLTEEIFGVKGKFYEPFKSNYYAKGIVTKIIDDNDYLQYIVSVPEGERNRTVLLRMKKPDRLPPIKKGSVACFVCNIMAKQKIKNENTNYFQDFIVQDTAPVN